MIRYETSLRSGDLDCFVLEHVVHDRPEVGHFGWLMNVICPINYMCLFILFVKYASHLYRF